MDKKTRSAAQSLYCKNPQCKGEDGTRTVLGTIVRGELQVLPKHHNVAHLNTDGASLLLVCDRCGEVWTWWPKDSSLTQAFLNTHIIRTMIEEYGRIMKAYLSQDFSGLDVTEAKPE